MPLFRCFTHGNSNKRDNLYRHSLSLQQGRSSLYWSLCVDQGFENFKEKNPKTREDQRAPGMTVFLFFIADLTATKTDTTHWQQESRQRRLARRQSRVGACLVVMLDARINAGQSGAKAPGPNCQPAAVMGLLRRLPLPHSSDTWEVVLAP